MYYELPINYGLGQVTTYVYVEVPTGPGVTYSDICSVFIDGIRLLREEYTKGRLSREDVDLNFRDILKDFVDPLIKSGGINGLVSCFRQALAEIRKNKRFSDVIDSILRSTESASRSELYQELAKRAKQYGYNEKQITEQITQALTTTYGYEESVAKRFAKGIVETVKPKVSYDWTWILLGAVVLAGGVGLVIYSTKKGK